ncbi:MAG: hypothetical protein CSB33_02255 [Desulfobacterales bacterium]|nr:MAG: hypothetical protein CSB33_02255 [Desulfobacterales bacterium]
MTGSPFGWETEKAGKRSCLSRPFRQNNKAGSSLICPRLVASFFQVRLSEFAADLWRKNKNTKNKTGLRKNT